MGICGYVHVLGNAEKILKHTISIDQNILERLSDINLGIGFDIYNDSEGESTYIDAPQEGRLASLISFTCECDSANLSKLNELNQLGVLDLDHNWEFGVYEAFDQKCYCFLRSSDFLSGFSDSHVDLLINQLNRNRSYFSDVFQKETCAIHCMYLIPNDISNTGISFDTNLIKYMSSLNLSLTIQLCFHDVLSSEELDLIRYRFTIDH